MTPGEEQQALRHPPSSSRTLPSGKDLTNNGDQSKLLAVLHPHSMVNKCLVTWGTAAAAAVI